MRVIAGRFKDAALPTPKPGTRPTTDRTKEAMFSHLDSLGVLDGARVLDLFAGTGALGIEALSRGARQLVAVESAGPAAMLIRRAFVDLQRKRSWEPDMTVQVIRKRAERFAAAYAGPVFDVIFIDPPYAFTSEACAELLAQLADSDAMDERSTIVLERSGRSSAPVIPEGWRIAERRDYGETAVFYIQAV